MAGAEAAQRAANSAGVSGRSMLTHRPLDTFGAAFFYLGLSDEFKDLLQPLVPQQNEYGTEVFYNFALPPGAA